MMVGTNARGVVKSLTRCGDVAREPRTVTSTIVNAMEQADSCDAVLIIMREKDGNGLWFGNDDLTIAEVNYMLDTFKFHLLGLRRSFNE